MRYPNLRYGNLNELVFYAQFYPAPQRVRILARELRRDERTVRDWLNGRKKIPFWVPELIRLRKMEHDDMLRQMNVRRYKTGLGTVSAAGVIEFKPAALEREEKPLVATSGPDALFKLRRSG